MTQEVVFFCCQGMMSASSTEHWENLQGNEHNMMFKFFKGAVDYYLSPKRCCLLREHHHNCVGIFGFYLSF